MQLKHNNKEVKSRNNQDQICCPVWSFAMDQLDASQRQPRDQSAFSHLIAAPAALGYLLAEPVQATATSQADGYNCSVTVSDSDSYLAKGDDDGDLAVSQELGGSSHSSLASSNDSQRPNGQQRMRRRQFRRSSNESVDKPAVCKQQLDKAGSIKRRQKRPTTASVSIGPKAPLSQANQSTR